MPLTIEQQRALAVAQAKRKRAEAEAGPSLRSETDAIIEEAAAAIPGGYEAFAAKPPNAERMRAMGYVPDPLAPASTGGFSKPRAQPQQVIGPLTGDTSQPNVFTDVMRGLEAPIAGLTGGGLEGWAKTTSRDPVRGAVEAVNFISPVDEAGRAYLGLRDTGAGLIEGDMAKAAQGAQQASIEGSFAALQMLPGSMTARGLTVPKNTLALNVADLERAAMQATRAPPVGKPAPQAAAPQPQPAPFSAPAEPKASSVLRNNADRIVGGGVGAFAGSAGDALAAPGDGNEGGPDIINPVTGAFAGMIAPRMAARGYRSARSAIQGGGFNEAVAVRAVRNALAPAGRSADEIAALNLSQYGDKPSVLADLTQNAQNFSVGLSRQPGRAAEIASEQSGDLARTRTGRLFSDVETTTNINPATVTADLDAAIKQASEEISPAYEALFANNAGVNSERLMQLADDPVVGPYVRRAIQASESLQTTAGQAPSNARTWDLVKRGLDRTIESQKRSGGQAAYELEKARGAIKDELDALMPEYKAVRDGADAPRMRDARKQGSKVAGGGLSVEQVRAIASKFTGKPLTALQMGAVEKIVLDIEKARGLDGLSSERMREVFGAVFSQDTADKLVARIRADQTILKNAQRRDPDFGSATSQAGMADRGMGAMAADAFRAVRNPLEAALAALSRSGAYTQDQRNRIAEMLYSGATDDNLARIYSNRPPRNPLNVEPPPTPQGPPVNRLGMRGNPEALGAAGGAAIGMATAPDQNGDGVVDAQERMLGGAGGALTGGIAGRGVRGGMNALAPKPRAAPAFDQRFMKEAQQLVSYNGGVDKAVKAQQYVIDQLVKNNAPQDRINKAVSVRSAIERMAERSSRELDEIVPMADAAPTGPKPIDPSTNYNIDPRGDKFIIRTDAGEQVLGAPEFSDRKQALAWLQGETRKARQTAAPDVAALKQQGFNTDKVYYHGSDKEFDTFDMSRAGSREIPWYGRGAYLTPDSRMAKNYANGGKVMPFYVRGKMLEIRKPEDWPSWLNKEADIPEQLKARGYVGLDIDIKTQGPQYDKNFRPIVDAQGKLVTKEESMPEVVVFDPANIVRAPR